MNRFLIIILLSLFLVSCSSKTVQELSNETQENTISMNEESLTSEDVIEYGIEDYKNTVIDCFEYYYDMEMEAELGIDEKSFCTWFAVRKDNGDWDTKTNYFQYKSEPLVVYHIKTKIWEDGKPSVEKQKFLGSFPGTLEIEKGPINIRDNHSLESTILGLAENGEEYFYFDCFEDEEYNWYNIYLRDSDSYGWIASDKNDSWILLGA